MTFGSLASALISGKTADFIGRRRVSTSIIAWSHIKEKRVDFFRLMHTSPFRSNRAMSVITILICGDPYTDLIFDLQTMWLSQFFCTLGWLAIIFAEVPIYTCLYFASMLVQPLTYGFVLKNVWWLCIGRLAMGFGVGFVSFVVTDWWLSIRHRFDSLLDKTNWSKILNLMQVPVYVAEITPKNLRGALTAGYQVQQIA